MEEREEEEVDEGLLEKTKFLLENDGFCAEEEPLDPLVLVFVFVFVLLPLFRLLLLLLLLLENCTEKVPLGLLKVVEKLGFPWEGKDPKP